jgi:phosphoribosylanthranilate isomerase
MGVPKIKYCGLTRAEDIAAANRLQVDYIGFVFAKKSKRYVTDEQAKALKALLKKEIQAVGVFVNEPVEHVADLLREGIIDIAQLHGTEEEDYIAALRKLTDRPLIQAFQIKSEEDVQRAIQSKADYILLDSGAGTGTVFDWDLLTKIERPYFLAGGLHPENVAEAIDKLHPYAVDVSSGIETDGKKDENKMDAFYRASRGGSI